MFDSPNARRFTSVVVLLAVYGLVAVAIASAQTTRRNDRPGYSDSDATSRARSAAADRRAPLGTEPAEILRNARTVFVEPNRHVDAEYLEYKLDKLADFRRWRLSFVKDRGKADLIIHISKTALNYVFSVVEPETSIVVVKGKAVAINGRVAAEDLSHQIVRRVREVRALPADGR